MRDQIKVLGILNVVMGSLTALAGVVAFLAMGTIAGFIIASLSSTSGSDYHDGAVAAPIIVTVGFAIASFFLLLGLPAIIGGWGLIRYRRWSRVLMLIVSFFHLFHVPLGTALGIYGFWVLLNDETRRILESGGAYAVPVPPANYGPVRPA